MALFVLEIKLRFDASAVVYQNDELLVADMSGCYSASIAP
jgi:hypothetical protein